MRFLLASVLVSGLVSLVLARPQTAADDEQSARAAITKAGGQAETDTKLAPSAQVVAKFESATDATLLALKNHPQIGAVNVLDATKCTEKGLAALKSLPNLRRLVLSRSQMSPARATAIAACAELRDLRLPGSGLRDAELATLKKLTLLELLDVSENGLVTDRGMTAVKELERLRALFLMKTAITDKGLMELKPLEGLRTLYVGGTKVTADATEVFTDEMPNLRVVRR
ncbi:MAG TPA: hypothetical protein VGE74_08280 [Gemmata sp.]